MRTQLRSLLLAICALAAQPFISAAPAVPTPAAGAHLAVPPAFVRNTGEANPLARFVSVGGGQPIFFTTNDVRIADPRRHRSIWLTFVEGAARDIDGEWSTGGHFTVLRHAGAVAEEPLYRDVVYRSVWHGIDARVSAAEKGLKYSFEVAPGGDPRTIHLRYSGADRVELTDAGEIVLDAGGSTIIDTRPVAYQLINGHKVSVPVRFVQFDSDVAFSVGSYDKTKPLVIDPTLVYSTYIGSSATDTGNAVAVDSTGAAYVVGSVAYGDLPVTAGAYQTTWHGDPNSVIPDAFVAKVNPAGTSYVYVTYLGGYNKDVATGVAVDANGNAYVAGYTQSSDFPTTSGSYHPAYGGSGYDGFVAKLNSTGTALVYSTYLGANQSTQLNAIAVDAGGNAYVVGGSSGNNFPVTSGGIPAAHVGGLYDAFLLKLNASGSQILYGTYIGGSGWDVANSVAVDGAGRAYVVGTTSSATGVGFGAPFQPYPNGPFFKSTDGGQNFTNVSGGGSSAVGAFAIDPVNPQTVYAGTSDRGLLKTTDGGAHWTQPFAGLGNGEWVYDIAINPLNTGTVLATSINPSTNGAGLWRSTDGFATARKVFSGNPANVAFAPSSPSTVYAVWSSSVLKSTDGGATWANLGGPSSSNNYAIAVDPTNASTIFIGNDNSIWKSTDGGVTWHQAFIGNDAVRGIAIDPTSSLEGYAVTSSGRLYLTASGGTSWSPVSNQPVQSARKVAFDGHTVYVTNSSDQGPSIAKSTDFSSTWTRLQIGGSTIPVLALAVTNGVIYAGTPFHSDAFLLKVDTVASSILYGTYIGGVLDDSGIGVALDPSGNPVVAVATSVAQTFPNTTGGPSSTAAVLRFSPTGTLVMSAFAMTSDARNVDPRAIAVDRAGSIYLAATENSGSPNFDLGVWIGQINPASGSLWAEYTLNGSHSGVGSPGDQPAGIAVGAAGEAYVTGTTMSTDYPTTAGAPQPSYASGGSDAFLSKVAFSGSTTPPPPTGTNLALNKPARASSSYSSQYAPQFAVDGSTTTRWSSQFSDPQWFEVDLQGTYNISEVILRWETAYGADYTVQVSNDDINWTTIKTVTGGDGGVDDLTGLSGTGRYVRVNGTRRATQWGYSFWEFEVYGSAGSTPPPPPPPPPPSTTDLALNHPVVSSSDYSSQYAAALAVDGNSSTRWSSQFSDPQWIYVDLGAKYQISRVKLSWEAAYAADFKIQVSYDAVHWTDWSTVQGNTSLTYDAQGGGTGRYVRMYGTRRGTPYGYSLWSFEVYGSPLSDTDVALHKTTTSSSDFSSAYAAALATDGDASTRWSSQFSDPQWIAVDLGGTFVVDEVKLTWEAAYGANYEIQMSNDGVNWWTATTVTGGAGGVDDLEGGGTARYVRMYGTQRGTPWGYSLWSFEVFGH